MKILSCHQPTFFPWMGWWEKLLVSDVFVIYDDAKFVKNEWMNRGQVTTPFGTRWVGLNMPKDSVHKSLNEALFLRDSVDNVERCLKEWYPKKKNLIDQLLDYKGVTLAAFNIDRIEFLLRDIFPSHVRKVCFSSSRREFTTSKGSQRLLEMCQLHECDVYLSGVDGRDYLDIGLFDRAGVRVIFQDFKPLVYSQEYVQEFDFRCCMLDVLLNCGSYDYFRSFESRCFELKQIYLKRV